MTKAELIVKLAQESGLPQTTSKNVLDHTLRIITATLKNEGRFALPGLGIFEVVKREKRLARNPRTNELMEIKAHKAIKFKAAKALKDTLN